jgi:hypothetical protein
MESSYVLKTGTRSSGPGGKYDGTFVQDWIYWPGKGHLDDCNGRLAITPDYPEGTYAYFLTDTFPFVPRCLMGIPDPSFAVKRDGRQRRHGPHSPSRRMR